MKMENETIGSLTGSQQKIEEYTSRIEGGESKEEIFEGLGPSFRTSIEERLRIREESKVKDNQEIEKLKQELGISTKKGTENPTEAEKIVSEIEPIDISQLNENIGIHRRKIDSKNISFKQDGDRVKVFYLTQEWYSKPGKIVEQIVGDKLIKVIVSNDASSPHASFEPLTNVYSIGPGAMEEFKKDPEMFLSSIDHEISHEEYFSLDTKRQSEINDLFLNDRELKSLLSKFAKALYTDPIIIGNETAGENYLHVHDIKNPTTESLLTSDGQKGLKDSRSIVFEINGQKKEVMVGLLITELISYMSSLSISEKLFDKIADNGKEKRGGKDPRYDVVLMCFDYIQNNPSIKEKLSNLKLTGRNKEMEDFFTGLLQKENR